MPRYVALLRGVSPQNASMPRLKSCLEEAGFQNVKTVLSSGNVVFDSRKVSETTLEARLEVVISKGLGRNFYTIVREAAYLRRLIELDNFDKAGLPDGAKCVVSFLREPHGLELKLPIEADGVRIIKADEREIFTAYVPNAQGPIFMKMIEKTFGKDITTRTLDTVRKCSMA